MPAEETLIALLGMCNDAPRLMLDHDQRRQNLAPTDSPLYSRLTATGEHFIAKLNTLKEKNIILYRSHELLMPMNYSTHL